jgi:hypothetical protein
MNAPQLLKAIPVQVINEQAAYGPFNLRDYFSSDTPLQFRAELKDGAALPKGMICTTDGVLTGIPAKGTLGKYRWRTRCNFQFNNQTQSRKHRN